MQSHATVAFLNKKSFFNGMSSSIPISMQREDVVNIMQKGCKNYLVSSYLLFFRCFRKMELRKTHFKKKHEVKYVKENLGLVTSVFE